MLCRPGKDSASRAPRMSRRGRQCWLDALAGDRIFGAGYTESLGGRGKEVQSSLRREIRDDELVERWCGL